MTNLKMRLDAYHCTRMISKKKNGGHISWCMVVLVHSDDIPMVRIVDAGDKGRSMDQVMTGT